MGVSKFLVVALLLVTPTLSAQHKFKAKQTQPDKARVLQIQDALVKQGRLPSASGNWDKPTWDALRAIATEHGWSTCHVPDSRVINLLGLGSATAGMGAPPPELSEKNILNREQAKWEKDHPEDCHE